MLTGQVPFPGRTAAQLANQHLHARPRINALPEHDREIINRALSKSPNDRFESCRELFDALQKAPTTGASQASTDTDASIATVKTEVGVEAKVADARRAHPIRRSHNPAGMPERLANAEIVATDPIVVEDPTPKLRPTLVIGIGDTGARIAALLRTRVTDQFGGVDKAPAIDFVILDSDQKTLSTIGRQLEENPLPINQVIHLPLRRSQSYRSEKGDRLKWISRRWLFNIPKSLRTEGLRPLGRLALVDNAVRVRETLSDTMQNCFSQEAIETSTEKTHIEFEAGPRVIVVGSISGATCGGSAIDVSYLARDLLDSYTSEQKEVLGVFTYATGRNPAQNELSAVNGYAFLEELSHFHNATDRFPGDVACELPPSNDPPFDATYLRHLGEELSDDEYKQNLEEVTNFLFLEIATNASRYFRAARKKRNNDSPQDDRLELRSFGTSRISCRHDDVLVDTSRRLCYATTQRWLAGNSRLHEESEEFKSRVEAFVLENKLAIEPLVWVAKLLIERGLNVEPDKLFKELVEQLAQENGNDPDRMAAGIKSELTQWLGEANLDDVRPGEEPPKINARLRPLLSRFVAEKCEQIETWLLQWIDDPEVRIHGAAQFTKCLAEMFEEFDESLQFQRQNAQQTLAGHEAIICNLDDPKLKKQRKQISETLLQYARARFAMTLLEVEVKIVHAIKGQLSRAKNTVTDLGRDVKLVQRDFDTSSEDNQIDLFDGDDVEQVKDVLQDLSRMIGTAVDDRGQQLLDLLDQRANQELLGESGLRAIFERGGEPRLQLPNKLYQLARNVLVESLADVNVAELLCRDEDSDPTTLIQESMEATCPRLLGTGGYFRVVMLCPQDTPSQDQLVSAIKAEGAEPTVVPVKDGDLVFCQEAGGISVAQTALSLIDDRRDLAEYAERVHTRADVDWHSLEN